MGDSYEITSKLDSIETLLQRIEDKVESLSEAVAELEAQGASMTSDMEAIRRDIDRLEPGVI
jgi:outer membrane murein-binding lipoprotein Lpp